MNKIGGTSIITHLRNIDVFLAVVKPSNPLRNVLPFPNATVCRTRIGRERGEARGEERIPVSMRVLRVYKRN